MGTFVIILRLFGGIYQRKKQKEIGETEYCRTVERHSTVLRTRNMGHTTCIFRSIYIYASPSPFISQSTKSTVYVQVSFSENARSTSIIPCIYLLRAPLVIRCNNLSTIFHSINTRNPTPCDFPNVQPRNNQMQNESTVPPKGNNVIWQGGMDG